MVVRELFNLVGFKVNESQLQNAESRVKSLTDKMESFGKKATTFLTLPFLAAGAAAVKFASDAQETQNMFNQVFRDSSE